MYRGRETQFQVGDNLNHIGLSFIISVLRAKIPRSNILTIKQTKITSCMGADASDKFGLFNG